MSQPAEYERQYSFTDYQTANPSDPLPGDQVDAELNAVKQTLDQLLGNLELIQRDDTALANNSVGIDQLKPEVDFGFNTVVDWQPGIAFVARDGAWLEGVLYRCLEAHTSTVFADNFDDGFWSVLIDFSENTAPVVEYIEEAGDDAVAAIQAAQAIAEAAIALLVTDATTQATNAATSASAAATSYDSFDDRYLGSKAADPTLDNDGNALLTGALYWNSGTSRMKAYNGSAWVEITGLSPTDEVFTNGVGFTAGTSTTITLANAYGTEANFAINFDGVMQGPDTYSYNDGTRVVTFDAAIPGGTSKIYVKGGMVHSAGTPSDGTVTTAKLAAGVVDGATAVTAATGDSVLIAHASDSNNVKKTLVSSILALAASDVSCYQVTDTTDIALSAVPTQANVGSTVALTIPAKGFIDLEFTGETISSGGVSGTAFGIRIGSTNYWATTSFNSGGSVGYHTSSYDSVVGTTVISGVGSATSANNLSGGMRVSLPIEALAIPTGAQTVQVIAGKVTANTTTIKGTVVTTRVYITVRDHT